MRTFILASALMVAVTSSTFAAVPEPGKCDESGKLFSYVRDIKGVKAIGMVSLVTTGDESLRTAFLYGDDSYVIVRDWMTNDGDHACVEHNGTDMKELAP